MWEIDADQLSLIIFVECLQDRGRRESVCYASFDHYKGP
jgi:hypothetical protein